MDLNAGSNAAAFAATYGERNGSRVWGFSNAGLSGADFLMDFSSSYNWRAITKGYATVMYLADAGYLGLGTTSPGAQLNVTSALEIFQTATLTAGSVGSLIAPYDTNAGETDAKGGNLNGAIVINNADNKIYARTGAAWKGAAIAGFSIPNYSKQKNDNGTYGVDETICPKCHQQMKPGDALGMYADKWYNGHDSEEGLHAVAAHLKCLRA